MHGIGEHVPNAFAEQVFRVASYKLAGSTVDISDSPLRVNGAKGVGDTFQHIVQAFAGVFNLFSRASLSIQKKSAFMKHASAAMTYDADQQPFSREGGRGQNFGPETCLCRRMRKVNDCKNRTECRGKRSRTKTPEPRAEHDGSEEHQKGIACAEIRIEPKFQKKDEQRGYDCSAILPPRRSEDILKSYRRLIHPCCPVLTTIHPRPFIH